MGILKYEPLPVCKGVSPVPAVTGVRPVPPSIIESKLRPRMPAEGVSMGTPMSATDVGLRGKGKIIEKETVIYSGRTSSCFTSTS